MIYKEWMWLIRNHPHNDLNGKYVAYDIDGTPLGEVIYRKGVVIARRKYPTRRQQWEIYKEFLNLFLN